MLNIYADFDQVQTDVAAKISDVDKFHVKFTSPCTVTNLDHIKAGSTREFVRKTDTKYFVLKGSKIVVTAPTIANIIVRNQGKLIV